MLEIRGRWAPIIAVLGCLGLTGCSGSDAAPAPTTAPTSSRSPTSTPSSTPTATAPALPAAARAGTRAGAEAFFRYFWDVYNYSYASLDTAPLRAISDPTCKFCAQALADLEGARSSSEHFVGGSIELNSAVAGPIDATGGAIVNAVATQSAGKQLRSDGTVARSFEFQDHARVDAGVRWETSKWLTIEVALRSPTLTP